MNQFCSNCGSYNCGYDRTIRLASDELRNTREYYILTWRPVVELSETRRGTRDKIIDIFCWNCCINLQNAEGEKIVLPEYDDAFPDDESCTWFGRFMKKDPVNADLPKCFYNAESFDGEYDDALMVIEVFAKLVNPEPFRAIGQIC